MKKKAADAREVRNIPQISDAELIVMQAVWAEAPATANQVVERLAGKVDWKPKTIQTLLARLAQKNALAFEKKGREYLFQPLVDAKDYAHAASRSFLSRFFDGEVAPFLASFLEREKLSKAEIEELKRILEKKKP